MHNEAETGVNLSELTTEEKYQRRQAQLRLAGKKYRETHREKRYAATNSWKRANREKVNQIDRAYSKKNRDKINSRKRAWNAKNKDKVVATQTAWREANRTFYLERAKAIQKRSIVELSDAYVRAKLRMKKEDAPDELVEAKRQQLLINRALKQLSETIKEKT